MQQILEIPYFAFIESCSAKGRSDEDWLVNDQGMATTPNDAAEVVVGSGDCGD